MEKSVSKIYVSVIIPAYNAEGTIKKCVDNLIFDECCSEIIIINDGSYDHTVQEIEKLRKITDKIKLFSTENGGVSKARNYGLREITGEYFAFIDADDYLSNDAISVMYKYSKIYQLDMCCISMVEKNGVKTSDNEYNVINKNSVHEKNDIGEIIEITNPRSVCAKLFKTSVIRDNDLFFNEDMSYAEDLEFMLRAYRTIEKVGICKDAQYIVENVNPNSLSKMYHNNIDYVLEQNQISLLKLFEVYPSYKVEYVRREIGLKFYQMIAFSDNLFRKGSPYNFRQSRKLIYIKLLELMKTDEFISKAKEILPKKKIDKVYYVVIKTKSPFLIAMLFYIKNKFKVIKQGYLFERTFMRLGGTYRWKKY